MQRKTIVMIQADEGKALTKGDRYCRSVLLREGDDGSGWTEIPIAEAEAARAAAREGA